MIFPARKPSRELLPVRMVSHSVKSLFRGVFVLLLVGPALAVPTRTLYVKSANTALGSGDFFGKAIAVSGDTVVIGAPGDNSSSSAVNGAVNENALKAGAAYVYVRSGNSWVQQAYLKSTSTAAGDRFGSSVAISGDTLVIGAPEKAGSNGAKPKAGAAFVFVRNGSSWTQQAALTSSSMLSYGQYGQAVAISGDTVLVGQDSTYPSEANFADVYLRTGSVWNRQTTLQVAIVPNENGFGRSLALDGDTAIIGAWAEDGPLSSGLRPPGEGAAYVFVRSGATWTQQARLKASNPGALDYFGWSVAISGETLVVGAYSENGGGTGVNPVSTEDGLNAGAAYVFTRSDTVWSEQAYLKASNTGANDEFGRSVAIAGDRIVVGAPTEDSSGVGIGPASNESSSDAGASYVFVRTGVDWDLQAFLKSSNRNPGNAFGGDAFGGAVAVSDTAILVGAIGEDGGGTGINSNPASPVAVESSGAVYVFDNLPALVTAPEISVKVAGKAELVDGSGSVNLGSVAVGKASVAKLFTIKNIGNADLKLLGLTKDGPRAAEVIVSGFTVKTIAPGKTFSFKVSLKPQGKGTRKAAIHLKNSDASEKLFDINLTGTGL